MWATVPRMRLYIEVTIPKLVPNVPRIRRSKKHTRPDVHVGIRPGVRGVRVCGRIGVLVTLCFSVDTCLSLAHSPTLSGPFADFLTTFQNGKLSKGRGSHMAGAEQAQGRVGP